MEVILLEKVQNLGGLGDVVKVRPGYGRNYLIPKGKAVPATAQNKTVFEARRLELEQAAAKALADANARRESMEGKSVTVTARAGEEGKLFGSVGPADVVQALAALGVSVQKSEIRLLQGPIRRLGDYEIEIYLHPEVSAHVNIKVVAESEKE